MTVTTELLVIGGEHCLHREILCLGLRQFETEQACQWCTALDHCAKLHMDFRDNTADNRDDFHFSVSVRRHCSRQLDGCLDVDYFHLGRLDPSPGHRLG